MLHWLRRRRVYKKFQADMAKGGRADMVGAIPVLVGPFSGGGKARAIRGGILAALSRHPDISAAPSVGIPGGGMLRGDAIELAKSQFRLTSGALLVQGEWDEERESCRLGFVSRVSFPAMDYWLDSEHRLPADLPAIFAEAVAVLALAALEPALTRDRRVLHRPLEAGLTRLDHALNRPPENPSPDKLVRERDRPALLMAYAQGAVTLAKLTGSEKILPQAVRAAGGAAAGFDAVRDARRASDARMLTGIALQRLGGISRDTGLLGQAIEAYEAALEPGETVRGGDAQARTRIRMAETWLDLVALGESPNQMLNHASKSAKLAFDHCKAQGDDLAYTAAARGALDRVRRLAQAS
jgi:hypothetical protein